ncbi:hypothetical protein ACJJTC_007126 [Scirpophaga incertulas]
MVSPPASNGQPQTILKKGWDVKETSSIRDCNSICVASYGLLVIAQLPTDVAVAEAINISEARGFVCSPRYVIRFPMMRLFSDGADVKRKTTQIERMSTGSRKHLKNIAGSTLSTSCIVCKWRAAGPSSSDKHYGANQPSKQPRGQQGTWVVIRALYTEF